MTDILVTRSCLESGEDDFCSGVETSVIDNALSQGYHHTQTITGDVIYQNI